MLVGDLDAALILAGGGVLGALAGLAGSVLADVLPARCGITLLASPGRRARRSVAIMAATLAIWIGLAGVLTGARELPIAHALLLLVTNGVAAMCVVTAAAIDLEHMILPDVLTLGPAVLCLLTSPVRAIGLGSSVAGALAGAVLALLPALLYRRLRAHSGVGLGDAKLALFAGAWLGLLAVPFVLALAGAQAALAAAILRVANVTPSVPPSVVAELDALHARAAAGDEAAREELASDPMAADTGDGLLAMRLPLGPFLALACVEVLFLRRWLVDGIADWLAR